MFCETSITKVYFYKSTICGFVTTADTVKKQKNAHKKHDGRHAPAFQQCLAQKYPTSTTIKRRVVVTSAGRDDSSDNNATSSTSTRLAQSLIDDYNNTNQLQTPHYNQSAVFNAETSTMLSLGWMQQQNNGDDNDVKIKAAISDLVAHDDKKLLHVGVKRLVLRLRETEENASLQLVQTIHPSATTNPLCAMHKKPNNEDERFESLMKSLLVNVLSLVRLSTALDNDVDAVVSSVRPFEANNPTQEQLSRVDEALAARQSALKEFEFLES